MSFWGGFVEGFATTAKEEIDVDVAKTDKIVNDTVKIGVQKALDTQEEIKADKKRIKTELEMLVGARFSLPKAASIVKAAPVIEDEGIPGIYEIVLSCEEFLY